MPKCKQGQPSLHLPDCPPAPFPPLAEDPPLQQAQRAVSLLVLSDTHNDQQSIRRVLVHAAHSDVIIHLGDHDQDILPLRDALPCPLYTVRGNCDMLSASPLALRLSLGGVRILAVHGHEHGAKHGTRHLISAAQDGGFGLVLFGHTHEPLVEHHGHFLLVNPGSAALPRSPYAASFAMITLQNGKATPHLIPL